MPQVKENSEPPSWAGSPVFMIGQNTLGQWVVREQRGKCGGLFVSRDAALRFVRAENGYLRRAVVMVSDNLELNISAHPRMLFQRNAAADDVLPQRRSA